MKDICKAISEKQHSTYMAFKTHHAHFNLCGMKKGGNNMWQLLKKRRGPEPIDSVVGLILTLFVLP